MKSLLLTVLAAVTISAAVDAQPPAAPAQKTEHFAFLENKGQITDQSGHPRTDIDFRLSSGNMSVFIGKGHIHYQWSRAATPFATTTVAGNGGFLSEGPTAIDLYRMDVQLLNAGSTGMPEKKGQQAYFEKYYLPQFGAEGVTARSYQKIIYRNVYPHIDWVLYIKNEKLEHDFVVHPGGNVADIRMQFKGTTGLYVNRDGSFTALTPFGSVTEAAPYSFQEDGSKVSSAYVLTNDIIGFTTTAFSGRLTIDPTVSWATYIGGNGFADLVEDLDISIYNDLYLGGETHSANNIATTGSHQVTFGGGGDGYLKKYDREGNVLWGTYYGGNDADVVKSVSCDSLGNVYIAGYTYSTSGIATTGSHQPALGGSSDVFFAKFDSAGTRIFGSYYGGAGAEGGHAKIAVKGAAVFISGSTSSTSGIATTGAHQVSLGGSTDAFVAKFSLAGIRQWGTYFGGTGADGFANSLACDNKGNVYLFGTTNSESAIATPGAHKTVYTFSASNNDHFLAKFNKNGVRQWATYYGGSGEEFGHFSSRNIGCDLLGNVYMTGATESTSDISTAGSHQNMFGGDIDIYLAKMDSNGVRQWATYYGGTGAEMFPSLHVADTHMIYLHGTSTSASGIASANGLQTVFAGGAYYGDAFLARFNGNGTRLYGSYFGGSGIDGALTSVSDKQGNFYLGGATNSISGIATPGSNQSTYPGALGFNGFLTKFCFATLPSLLQIQGPDTICSSIETIYSILEVEDATAYIWTLPAGWSGSSNSHIINITPDQQSGTVGVQVVRCNDTSELLQFTIHVFPSEPPVITVNNFILGTVGTYASYQWLLNGQPVPGGNTANITVAQNGDYRVVTVNANGCTDTSAVYTVSNVTGLEDITSIASQISIFPNPAIDKVFIQSPVKLIVTVTTIEGKVLVQQASNQVLDMHNYPAGIYMLRLTSKEGVWIKTEKIIKMK
ncbi:MAG: SBBP repeat-containing protein [Taibaiella sp.]|jgi:hypothetical protein